MRKIIGMTRLKKKNARLRIARRKRTFVSVHVRLTIPMSLSQPPPGQFDEYVFERRRKHFQALQFVVLGFQLFDERHNRLRRTS